VILVTGANGFVGRALCRDLAGRGLPVRAAVRGRGTLEGAVAVGDLADETDWSKALDGVEVVVHLAARVHVMHETLSDPLAAFRAVNVGASLNLARQCLAHGVKRFVYVSSIKVNGEVTQPGLPFRHDDLPRPQDPYGISKLEAERGLMALAESRGLELVIVRPPLVYGPGVGANFGKMIEWVRRGVPLPLGAVHNRRALVYIDNLTDLLVAACRHRGAANRVLLVSDGTDVSTTTMLNVIAAALGRPSRLMPVPARLVGSVAGVLGQRSAAQRLLGSLELDIVATQRWLGWAPPVGFEQAIAATVGAHVAEH
jgi:nucleoside-diphosphate-sugar epimerase